MANKSENINRLINILNQQSDFISASQLARLLGLNSRTIRNYLLELKKDSRYKIISSNNGYKLEDTKPVASNTTYINEVEARLNKAMYTIISSANKLSVFDLAEQNFVSENTILKDITDYIKPLFLKFNLEITYSNFEIELVGSEKDKRKLIGHLATSQMVNHIDIETIVQGFDFNLDVRQIKDSLQEFLDESSLTFNDYTKDNLFFHIIIIFIRLNDRHYLGSDDSKLTTELMKKNCQEKEIHLLVAKIAEYFKELFNKEIPVQELKQLNLLIMGSVDLFETSDITLSNLSDFVGTDLLDTITHILNKLMKLYGLKPFDSSFIIQFAIHIYSMLQRIHLNIRFHHSLVHQFKHEHAPVYDMAVYFSQQFSDYYSIKINEDEIALIAFHLGVQIENTNKLSCVIVYDNYHLTSSRLSDQIKKNFDQELYVVGEFSVSDYRHGFRNIDLIITSSPALSFSSNNGVLVSPLFSNKNISDIRLAIESAKKDKKRRQLKNEFLHYFNADLFLQDIHFKTREEYLTFMGNELLKRDYIDADYIVDVKKREKFSNTAFTDFLAVPHSISVNSKKSFAFIVKSVDKMPWDEHKVNFIILIGISKENQNQKSFRIILDVLIENFSSPKKVSKLLKTDDFDSFINELIETQDIQN